MIMYNFECSLHGKYVGTSSKQKCPKCLEIKNDFIKEYSCINVLNDTWIVEDKKDNGHNVCIKIKIPNTEKETVLFWSCSNCGKLFIKHYKNINKLFNSFEEKSRIYCSHICANQVNVKQRTSAGYCIICNKYVQTRDSVGRCTECSAKFALERTKQNISYGICKKCGKFANLRDINGFCYECSSNHVGISFFQIEEGKPIYYDLNSAQWVLWEEYKSQFINQYETDIYNNFKIIPTFRKEGSTSWFGAKQAFEFYLKELCIGWFVYLKFYIDHNGNSRPLIVGKSGSLLVNKNGSDISFSTDIKDGPARRFLYEEHLCWDVTKVAVLPCETEDKAYLLENKIMREMNLFSS